MEINMSDTYTTEDECEVKIYSLEGNKLDLVHGAIKRNPHSRWEALQWNYEGTCGIKGKNLKLSVDALIEQANNIDLHKLDRVEGWLEASLMFTEAGNKRKSLDAVKEAIRVLRSET